MHPGASNPCIFDLSGTSRNAGRDNSDTRCAHEECAKARVTLRTRLDRVREPVRFALYEYGAASAGSAPTV